MNRNIFGQIRSEINDFTDQDIEIVPGYNFNQYETIKRCHLYVNSKFEDNSAYYGRQRLFFNIVNFRCEVATRMLNIDTKHLRLWPTNPISHYSTFFLEKEIKYWIKKNGFNKVLNQIAEKLPEYGSVVLRKLKKGARVQDLRRMFNDPTVDCLEDSRFLTFLHYMTPSQLREKVKEGWDADQVEAIIKKAGQGTDAPDSYENDASTNVIRSTPYIKVYERFGMVPEEWLENKEATEGSTMVKALFIVAEPFLVGTKEGKITSEEGSILYKSKWFTKYPVKEFHYKKTEGRWLGVGVVETLFNAQERVNELANQKRIAMEISSMHLFQTQDQVIIQNILNDVQNGDVLKTGSNGLNPVATEERNLSAFASEEQRYDVLADRQSFANDLLSGGQIPASTPATNAVIQNNNATSVFLFKRQNESIGLSEFFNEFVIPQALKDLSAEHIMRFTGSVDELAQLDKEIIKVVANEKIMEMLLSGQVVTEEEKAKVVNQITMKLKAQGAARYLKMKENLYKDTEFEFDYMVDNEQEDVAVMANNLLTLMTAITQNPQILSNPIVKKLLYKYAEKIGISPSELELADTQNTEQQMQQIQNLQETLNNAQAGGAETLQVPVGATGAEGARV